MKMLAPTSRFFVLEAAWGSTAQREYRVHHRGSIGYIRVGESLYTIERVGEGLWDFLSPS